MPHAHVHAEYIFVWALEGNCVWQLMPPSLEATYRLGQQNGAYAPAECWSVGLQGRN